ncbi:hypothetical protein MNBD_GAMMA05-2343 [hydrothermal vent metagenome]|uniref:DUF3108 domain-containing protein n=1 Tax=hydrothermal vent metagenome TaxID=652676 RepID=A0A3B0WQ69_9ZZZZ
MIYKRLKRLTLFITALLHCSLLSAQALPEFHAKYAIQKYGIKVAEANYQLSHTGSGYKFSQNTELNGLISMFADDTVSAVSYIDDVDGELLLKKYKYTQTGREKNRNEDFSIQWNTSKESLNGIISGVVRNKKISLETTDPVWEVLSFQIPLMIDADENIKHYPYKALLKGEIDTYEFILTSNKKFTFAGKEYKLLQMVRTDPHKKQQLHIWIAPQLHNLPVIIENYRKGKEHSRMQLESVQFADEEILSEPMLNEQSMDNDEEY